MKILIILKYLPTISDDQKSDLLFSFVKAHEEEGHEVFLFTSGRVSSDIYKVLGSKATFWQKLVYFLLKIYSKSRAECYKDALLYKKVIEEHNKKKIDMVLAVCTADHPAIHAKKIKDLINVPYVVQEHKTYERTKKSLSDIDKDYLIALREADRVVAVSSYLANIMEEIGIRNDIGVLTNMISDEFFEYPDKKDVIDKIKKWKKKNYLFGGWTRWREFKRIDLLLRAFLKVKKEIGAVKLIIVGPIEPEENESWVKQFIKKNKLEEDVWLFGNADRHEIKQIAYSVDCCVLPSDYETFGLPALEAIAAGKPVVATKCNGPEDIINDKSLGVLVDRGSSNKIKEAMIKVYNKQDNYNAEKIKKNAFRRFSREKVKERFTMLYEEILK